MSYFRKCFPLLVCIALGLALLVPSLTGVAQATSQPDLQAIDAFLVEQVRANRIPGVAVAIVQDDQVLFEKGYGAARPGEPVTAQTQFYIGSVTKSFTALAVMQLVEQGKLELDAPVQAYLPWFQVADAKASSQITVRHLLNHTSGLSENGDPNVSAETASLEGQARLLQYARLTAPVGTQFQYYNQNYRLLGLLIEHASGQSYADYLRSHIFEPLGMAHTTADPARASNLAQGYSRLFGFPLAQTQRFVPGGLPSGYVISTADDMAKFLLAQMSNRQADGRPLLTAESLTAMRSLPAGIPSEYGMGWMVLENGNMLAHGGLLDYFQSFIVIRLKEKLGLVILYNQTGMENMLLENDAIRSGLLALLNRQAPRQMAFGWVGWLLLALAAADLLHHLRLFWTLPGWSQKASQQKPAWLWTKVLLGISIPLFILFGLPLVVALIKGGVPGWAEPLKLMPDLILWLLVGMSLDLIRSLLYARALVLRKE